MYFLIKKIKHISNNNPESVGKFNRLVYAKPSFFSKLKRIGSVLLTARFT
jgi:hypothetical protein